MLHGNPPQFPLTLKVERFCSFGQMLLRGEPAQGHVREVIVVRR